MNPHRAGSTHDNKSITEEQRCRRCLDLLVSDLLLSSPNSTSTTGSDETDLSTSAGSSADGGGLTNMLMVTTTVGMLNGIHSNTTNLRPRVPLCLVLVVGVTR